VIGEVFGTNIQFDFRAVFDETGVAQTTEYTSCVPPSPDRFLIAYDDAANSDVGTVIVNRQHPSAVIGVARESATEGQSAPVTLFVNRGISDAHSGLTPGWTYYAQPGGGVTTESTEVLLGVAISPTEMLFLP